MTGGIALILGDIGRNFAAGMSGVLHTSIMKMLYSMKEINLEMVELENSKNDMRTIRELLENHIKYTKSPKAIDIVKHWTKSVNNFIKVMPTDYKRALEMMAGNKLEKSI